MAAAHHAAAGGELHHKLGPLQAWQWVALAAGAGGIYLLYKHEKDSSSTSTDTSTAGTTGSSDDGDINPTTGEPYASGGGGWDGGTGTGDSTSAGSSTDSGTTLSGELSDVTGFISALETAGLVQAPGTTGPAGLTSAQQTTLNKDLSTLNKTLTGQSKTLKNLQTTVKKLAPAKKTTKDGGKTNPGHKVTTHPGGKKTVASSAPANSEQHKNIQPPNHQKAAPKPKPKPKPVKR